METEDSTQPRIPNPTTRPLARNRWLAGLGALLAVGALSLSMARAQTTDGGDPTAVAGPMGPGGEGFMAFRMQRLLGKIGATDSQKSQIKAIWDGLRPQLQTLHQQHAQLHQQIGQALSAPTIDPSQVETLRQQSVQLMDKISTVVTQGMVSSAQVLTPDQRKAALAEIQAHRGRHHGPHGGAAGGN
jgi:Spy/CpxP family protein refolding chaperone